MTSNVQKALLLPEIVQEIASYCEYREQRDLAYTCRWLFSLVTPVIWKEVRGVDTVIQLIPGVEVSEKYNNYRGEDEYHRDIIFDESLLDASWTRYWYYAPFVHHIMPFSAQEGEVHGTPHVSGWRFLFMKLQGSVLLPNLRSLDRQEDYFVSQFDCLAWFVLLLSPSLQKLNLDHVTPGPENGLPATRPLSLLLGAISKSPVADSSRFVATRDQWHPSEQTLASLSPSEYPEGSFWFSNLLAPTGLRDLEITILSPSTLWDEFCIIGLLPCLERLETYLWMDDFSAVRYNLKTTPLPSSSFPSLRALILKGTSHLDLFHWVWSLKPMVSGLSSAHITVPNFGSNRQSSAVNFAQFIHNSSPSIIELSIDMSSTSDEMGELEVACELLSTIPLQALTLDCVSAQVGDYPSGYPRSTFHHLRRLHISPKFNRSDWATLPKIAKAFPNLEYLNITASVESESYESLDTNCINHMAFQPIDIHIKVYYVERGRTDEGNREIIRTDIKT
ncbi:unnamed protein product [Rhizoctonia solani]|uniref:F-box domain-containing protein n=1 Tax=Rhizoctonia solani TaxID=456999 RepID=A0A8H3C7R3_9AGAM|nr:unnamed protein product [Rhizoctonia solani]